MFFSYDHEGGFKFHETPAGAKARAEKALDMDRDDAEDGWDDNVTDICWGEVKGRVVETMCRPTTPEDVVHNLLGMDAKIQYALNRTSNALERRRAMMKYYKWTAGGWPVYGYGSYVMDGWQPDIVGSLIPSRNAFSVLSAKQVSKWCGTELWEVEPRELKDAAGDFFCRSFRFTRKLRWDRGDMIAYARWCAERSRGSTWAERAERVAERVASREVTHAAVLAADMATCAAAERASSIEDERARAAHVAERVMQLSWIEERIGEKL
jgi:hypothetical protein